LGYICNSNNNLNIKNSIQCVKTHVSWYLIEFQWHLLHCLQQGVLESYLLRALSAIQQRDLNVTHEISIGVEPFFQ
jgi:hypothetical protein